MNDRAIAYDVDKGLYCNDTGLVYERVSDFMARFTPEFNREMISRQIAKRDGVKQEEVLDEWKEAADKGTDFHNTLEYVLKGLSASNNGEYESAARWIRDYILDLNYHHFDSEIPVYDHELHLAGTPDIVGYRSRSKRCIVDIHDAKGNLVKFTTFGDGKFFLGPIKHLEYCYYNRTAIQMSLYMYMKEQEGYRPGNLTALVIDRDEPSRRRIYNMPYMKSEIENMIDYAFPKN